MNHNIVIGIEGYVGAGKTSICKELLNQIPDSILLHGGNLYRAIVYAVMNSGIDLKDLTKKLENIDIKQVMDKMKIEIKLNQNRETELYMAGNLIKDEELQSPKASMAVSMVGGIADNSRLYSFARDLINQFKEKYHVIVSGRDLMNIYPDLDYHIMVVASLEERVKRKANQYCKDKLNLQKLRESIVKRDELQEKAGYYKIYPNTIQVDVTECESVEESTKKVLGHIKLLELI